MGISIIVSLNNKERKILILKLKEKIGLIESLLYGYLCFR